MAFSSSKVGVNSLFAFPLLFADAGSMTDPLGIAVTATVAVAVAFLVGDIFTGATADFLLIAVLVVLLLGMISLVYQITKKAG
jgi:hypothetical protein